MPPRRIKFLPALIPVVVALALCLGAPLHAKEKAAPAAQKKELTAEEQKLLEEPEKACRAKLEVQMDTLGREHPETLKTRLQLAQALQAQHKPRDATEELWKVVNIRERVLGDEHPDTVKVRYELADALFSQIEIAAAAVHYRSLLAIFQHRLGLEHPDTLMCRYKLALTLLNPLPGTDSDPVAAAKEHRAILAIRERVLGAEHPDVFDSCHSLAQCIKYRKNGKEALTLFQRAEAGYLKIYGPEDPRYKYAKNRRQEVEENLKRPKAKKRGGR